MLLSRVTLSPLWEPERKKIGTEVGSDLIVLQKQTEKGKPNFWEELFVTSSLQRETETYNNDYFYNLGRVVQTKAIIGTDPYGKPAQNYIYEGSIKSLPAIWGRC